MPKIHSLSLSFAAALLVTAVVAPGCGSLKDLAEELGSGHSGDGGGGQQCSYGGKTYPIGASFPSEDGCNVCSCDSMGVACTLIACGGTGGTTGTPSQCSYGGKTYPIGASFPSEDGCNVCSCDIMGVACTLKACGGTGGTTGTPPQPTCEKLMVPAADGCASIASLKTASTKVCADRMEVLNGMEPSGVCADGASAQGAIAVCCVPSSTPPDTTVSCSPGMNPSGVPCTICVDPTTGKIVKTDCAK